MFVKIMADFGLRELYKTGFANLQLKFFQLERLVKELLPDLSAHFVANNIEIHMFASQWFLTLFAAKVRRPPVAVGLLFCTCLPSLSLRLRRLAGSSRSRRPTASWTCSSSTASTGCAAWPSHC